MHADKIEIPKSKTINLIVILNLLTYVGSN